MDMQVKYALSGVRSDICHQPIACPVYLHLPRDVRCGAKQFASQRVVLFLQSVYIGDVLFGDNQDVHRRLRVDVFESVDVFILVHADRRYPLLRDSAKDAIVHSHALPKY